jgi:hypothetical protein
VVGEVRRQTHDRYFIVPVLALFLGVRKRFALRPRDCYPIVSYSSLIGGNTPPKVIADEKKIKSLDWTRNLT